MVRADARPSRLAAAASLVLIGAALHFARGLFLPLALAALLSLLLLPLVRLLQRLGGGQTFSILAVALSSFLLVGSFAWITVRQIAELGRNFPEYKGRVIAKAGSLWPVEKVVKEAQTALQELGDEIAASTMSAPTRGKVAGASKVEVVPSVPKPMDIIGGALVSIFESLGTTVLVFILVIFFLIYHVDLRDRLVHLVGDSRVNVTTQTLTEAVQSVSRYLFLQAAMNAAFGTLVALGLLLLGLPNALLWGMLAALLRFVPYAGTWIAASMPFILSIAVFDGWGRPLAILAGWSVLEIVIANFAEPWVYGPRTGLSPLSVILSAFFWTWLWGGAGLLLAIPLTVSLVVVGKNIPQLAFLQTLLGSEAPLEPRVQLYHRLLAPDPAETVELVDRFQAEKPPQEVYDLLLLPALGLAETDRSKGRLDEEREGLILKQLRDLVEDLGERFEEEGRLPAPGSPAPSTAPRIVALPAALPADGLAALMLTQLLSGRGWRVETVPEKATAGEKVDLLGEPVAQVVVISAVSPSSFIPVRYLYKRIRRLHPKLAIVIGLWNAPAEPSSLQMRRASDPNVRVVTTLKDAVEQIRQICQAVIPQRSRPPTELRVARV